MDASMGAEKATGVLSSSQGNSFRAAAPGAKVADFAKHAPVATNTAASGANAGKENATATTRGAAATASTSGEPDAVEKRWQVREHPNPPYTTESTHRGTHTPAYPERVDRANGQQSRKRIPLSVATLFSRRVSDGGSDEECYRLHTTPQTTDTYPV